MMIQLNQHLKFLPLADLQSVTIISDLLGESVATYIAELKRLSEHCEFAGTLEDMLLYVIASCAASMIAVFNITCWQNQTLLTRRLMNLL